MAWRKEYSSRKNKASKITMILKDHCEELNPEWICLDIGCGSGEITSFLANNFSMTIGLEPNLKAIKGNKSIKGNVKPFFIQADGMKIPLADNSVDLIICAQVYEHISSPNELLNEIWKKLKLGGMCFFSGPNKWALVEEHYWLPFLSWIPKCVADRYLQLFRRGDNYDIHSMSYWELRRLAENFSIVDYSQKILMDPEKYSLTNSRFAKIIPFTPLHLLPLVAFFVPNFNWLPIKQ